MSNIILSRILLRGTEVKDSDLIFKKGVNLITGGSDTGKTYAYELINFAFGGNDVPNEIKESEGYNIVFLELIIENIYYTIIRFFDNPNTIKVCLGQIKEINDRTVYEEFSANARAKKSISSFLMNKLGYNDKIYLKKVKTKNDLQQLTIRSYLKSFMISEEKITAKTKSIIETELTHPSETFTSEKFRYFLTKTGNRQKIKSDKNGSMRATNKIELLQELLSENTIKLMESKFELDKSKCNNIDVLNMEELSKIIQAIENDITATKDKILEKQTELNNNAEEKRKVEQTINRFNILAEQYKVEMERLDFIYEGESYLSQISKAICPLCNSEVEEEFYNQDTIYKAFNAEKNKISKKSIDINYAIKDMKQQKDELYKLGDEIEIEINQLQDSIDSDLIPNMEKIRINYDECLKHNQIQTKIGVYESEISNLESKIEIYEGMVENKKEVEDTKLDNTVYLNRLKELCTKMKELLKEFHFAENIQVEFNYEEMDFIVNNQKRKAYGQGYSSLVYIAFVLSLKWIMDKYNIPTPNFIIFDSPFTSLTEGDEIKEKKVLESNVMVDSFFEYAIKEYKDKQIILFENSKEKYESVNEKVNYIHFTKNDKFGRYGFINK